jgi:hypothetical protein
MHGDVLRNGRTMPSVGHTSWRQSPILEVPHRMDTITAAGASACPRVEPPITRIATATHQRHPHQACSPTCMHVDV